MSKKRDEKLFAYEVFMTQATKEGRVRREELSMKVLKPDLSLQARVDHINLDHVRALHEILKNGQPLAPIIVFEIEELKGKVVVQTFKIADGFHRHEVYRKEGLPAIPCIVIKGTLQEAIEYAASANQTLSLKRTRDDVKKAVFMLLENGWMNRSSPLIGKQVGVSQPTVDKYRAEFCSMKKVPIPEKLLTASGEMRTRRRKLTDPRRLYEYKTPQGTPHFMTKIGNKTIHLGGNREEAEARMREAEANSVVGASSINGDFTILTQACASRGIGLLPTSGGVDSALHFVRGYRTGCHAVSVAETNRPSDVLLAFAGATLIASHFGLSRKFVIRKSDFSAYGSMLSAIAKAGVEVVTLDEFVAAVKADEASQSEGGAS